MDVVSRVLVVDEVCRYLRNGAVDGRWPDGKTPSVRALSKALGVSPTTVMKAFQILTSEGFFVGEGLARRIAPRAKRSKTPQVFRLGVMLIRPVEKLMPLDVAYLGRTVASAKNSGMIIVHAAKTKEECGDHAKQLNFVIGTANVDAWLVICPDRDLIGALFATGLPVFSYGGVSYGFPVSGVSVPVEQTVVDVTRRLIAYGHQRIVLMAPSEWVTPLPQSIAKAFLAELNHAGLKPGERPGSYNLPIWDNTRAGAFRVFEELFRLTPPTAIIFIDNAPLVLFQGFLSERRLSIPQDVSVFVTDKDAVFDWIHPKPAHATYDMDEVFRQTERWIAGVLRGRVTPKWHYVYATLDVGKSLAAAPGKSFAY